MEIQFKDRDEAIRTLNSCGIGVSLCSDALFQDISSENIAATLWVLGEAIQEAADYFFDEEPLKRDEETHEDTV